MPRTPPTTRTVVEAHLAAFNAHDSARLLAGFTDDAVWATGQDVLRGRAALAELFDESLWQLQPELITRRLLTCDLHAAAELIERVVVDGQHRKYSIAVFFEVDDGLIRNAKVYREGTAEIE